MNKKYTLEINKFLKYSIWALPLLSIMILIIFFIAADIHHNVKILFTLPFFGFAFFNWSKYLRRPVKLDVFEDSAILHNIFNKETNISFSDITSIESNNSQALIIRTRSNKIIGVNGFAEFSRFIEDAKAINKEIIVKGL